MNRRGQAHSLDRRQAFAHIADELLNTGVNALRSKAVLEVEGRRHGKPGAGIANAFRFIIAQPRRGAELVALVRALSIVMPTPARLQRLQPLFTARSKVEKARARRRQDPFVTVAAVVVAGNLIEVKRDHSGRMRAVDDGHNTVPPRFRT